jgi:hypothetical protein
MIKRKRKNPLHIINGIRYEIIDLPKYDEERVVRQFSEILNKKFKVIINYIPLILFKKLRGRIGELSYEPINADVVNIVMNSNYVNKNNIVLRMLFHELGHYLYRIYLSDEAIDEFQDYIKDNTKRVNISQLIDLTETFSSEELKLKYPLQYVLIGSFQFGDKYKYYLKNVKNSEKNVYSLHFLEWLSGTKVKLFDKPASAYIPDNEEIFCEIFANYMMYDLRLLHSDNYRILKTLIPELRN